MATEDLQYNGEVHSVVLLCVYAWRAVWVQLGLSGSKRGVRAAIRVWGRQLGATEVGSCREDVWWYNNMG